MMQWGVITAVAAALVAWLSLNATAARRGLCRSGYAAAYSCDNTRLWQALTDADVPTVRYELATGAVNVLLPLEGVTPWHAACFLQPESPDMVRAMLQHIRDKNAAAGNGQTCASLAAEAGNIEVLKLLVQARADLNAVDSAGDTPLLLALRRRRVEAAALLIKVGVDVENVSTGASDGMVTDAMKAAGVGSSTYPATALQVAAAEGLQDVVQLLVSVGANVNTVSSLGATALMLAAYNGRTEVVKQLVRAGAAVDQEARGGFNALLYAAWSGAADAAVELINAGASIDHQLQDRQTALHLAAKRGHVTFLRRILQLSADASRALQQQDVHGSTPLLAACGAHHVRCVDILLEFGASANLTTRQGVGCLHMLAAAAQAAGVVGALIKAGAHADSKTSGGLTPLVAALLKSNQPMAEALLQHGASASLPSPGGETIAAIASRLQLNSVLELLRNQRTQAASQDEDRRIADASPVTASASAQASVSPCAAHIMVPTRTPFKGAPPTTMPDDLRQAYTRCGQIAVGEMYVDDTSGGKGSSYRYGSKEVERLLQSAVKLAKHPSPLQLGKRGWLQEALNRQKNFIREARVVVFGTMTPVVETTLLAMGAARVTTVEYNRLSIAHANITVVQPPDVQAEPSRFRHQFDVALAINSFHHDGLGRYGDPLAPDGDLLSMEEVRTFWLKKDGLLVMTVPIGPDLIVWNLHRRYGRVRLPLLLHGWRVVDTVEYSEELVDKDPANSPLGLKTYEPVFVLTPA